MSENFEKQKRMNETLSDMRMTKKSCDIENQPDIYQGDGEQLSVDLTKGVLFISER